MNMKKFFVVCVLALGVFAVSCSEDDDSSMFGPYTTIEDSSISITTTAVSTATTSAFTLSSIAITDGDSTTATFGSYSDSTNPTASEFATAIESAVSDALTTTSITGVASSCVIVRSPSLVSLVFIASSGYLFENGYNEKSIEITFTGGTLEVDPTSLALNLASIASMSTSSLSTLTSSNTYSDFLQIVINLCDDTVSLASGISSIGSSNISLTTSTDTATTITTGNLSNSTSYIITITLTADTDAGYAFATGASTSTTITFTTGS